MKCTHASALIVYGEFFTESVQQMIDDGVLTTKEEIVSYITNCLIEDIETKVTDPLGFNELKRLVSCSIDIR